MKKFQFVFIAMFLSAPAVAKICMVNNPTIMATQAQLAALADLLVPAGSIISSPNPYAATGGADFNASRSNAAYGRRSEVAPANYAVYYYIKY